MNRLTEKRCILDGLRMMDRLTERDESPCMCCDGIDSCRVSCGNKKNV